MAKTARPSSPRNTNSSVMSMPLSLRGVPGAVFRPRRPPERQRAAFITASATTAVVTMTTDPATLRIKRTTSPRRCLVASCAIIAASTAAPSANVNPRVRDDSGIIAMTSQTPATATAQTTPMLPHHSGVVIRAGALTRPLWHCLSVSPA